MNQARDRRRQLARFRYLRATAADDTPMPVPPWWTRPAGVLPGSTPFVIPIRIDLSGVRAAIDVFLAKLSEQLRTLRMLPEGHELAFDKSSTLPTPWSVPTEPASIEGADADNAMITSTGDRFFPDNPGDAAIFASEHGAAPEHPDRWPWPACRCFDPDCGGLYGPPSPGSS